VADCTWEFEKNHRQVNVRVDGQLVFNRATQVLNAALAGLGLAYLHEGLAQRHLARGRLLRVLEDWCPPFAGITCTTRAVASRRRRSRCWSMR